MGFNIPYLNEHFTRADEVCIHEQICETNSQTYVFYCNVSYNTETSNSNYTETIILCRWGQRGLGSVGPADEDPANRFLTRYVF